MSVQCVVCSMQYALCKTQCLPRTAVFIRFINELAALQTQELQKVNLHLIKVKPLEMSSSNML